MFLPLTQDVIVGQSLIISSHISQIALCYIVLREDHHLALALHDELPVPNVCDNWQYYALMRSYGNL